MKVLLYENMHEAGVELLRQRAEVMIAQSTSEEELARCVGDVDAIIIRMNGAVTGRIMDAAPNLMVIGRHGVGVDNIDVVAATQRSIWVVNTPLANREAVAEHVVGMMLILAKHLRQADIATRQGHWGARHELIGMELYGKTVGIVGMGNIGSRVAEICRTAFNMQIMYHDVVRRESAEVGLEARRCDLREVFSGADFVSVHVPMVPETDHLVGAELLSLMKPTAYLINASRGGIVDEGDLVEALRAGTIAGAGLDTFEDEFTSDHLAVFDLENVIVTPHMAAHTEEAMIRMSLVAEDVLRVLDGERPEYPVNNL